MGEDAEAAAEMVERVYGELRALAASYFRGQPSGHTLQPTALVHEVFLKLASSESAHFRGREHFFAVAATAMRQVLADHARRRRAQKRGGDRVQVTLTDISVPDTDAAVDLVALDDVLAELERLNPRQAQIVAYRFLGGLTLPEIAQLLEVSLTTVEKDWRRARAWLAVELVG